MGRVKERDSNMELLRIIAMVIIMLVHANFRALGYPSVGELSQSATSTFMRYYSEALCIMGVNVFVMLSGWYGIRLKPKRLLELLFQIVFFVMFVTLVACVFEKRYPNLHDIGFLLLKDNYNYWFIKAYLMLYIMSPVLNSFVEYATKEQFRLILLFFFGFIFLWGWILDGAVWIKHGHSGIFFMGLYLLSRYMNLYAVKDINIRKTSCVIVYLLMSLLIAIFAFVMLRYGKLGAIRRIYYYTCPLVIIQAAAFMLFFTKFKFKSATINWIAISTLAIYLVHSSPFWSRTFYDNLISDWFTSQETCTFLIRTATLVFVTFWLSIFVDKIRIALWNILSNTNH